MKLGVFDQPENPQARIQQILANVNRLESEIAGVYQNHHNMDEDYGKGRSYPMDSSEIATIDRKKAEIIGLLKDGVKLGSGTCFDRLYSKINVKPFLESISSTHPQITQHFLPICERNMQAEAVVEAERNERLRNACNIM